MNKLTIASRKSPMAMRQAEMVRDRLQALHPDLKIRILALTSKGDKTLDQSLAKIGGKGLFIKELEEALLAKKADIAVHCAKDMPGELPEGLCLPVFCERDDPRDALLCTYYKSLSDLPEGAVVGTSSLRRQAQVLMARPDLKVNFLRGNANSRIEKLKANEFDAILLAVSGLERLGLQTLITEHLSENSFIPAIGQGALTIETRAEDEAVQKLIAPLHHTPTAYCVKAERAVGRALEASCSSPVAAYAKIVGDEIFLSAMVASPDGKEVIHERRSQALVASAERFGEMVAQALIEQGAKKLLSKD